MACPFVPVPLSLTSLVQVGWGGFGLSEDIWANIILVVALAIMFIVTYSVTNVIMPLPVAWAYFAIFKAEDSKLALIDMVVLLIISIFQLYRNKYYLQEGFL